MGHGRLEGHGQVFKCDRKHDYVEGAVDIRRLEDLNCARHGNLAMCYDSDDSAFDSIAWIPIRIVYFEVFIVRMLGDSLLNHYTASLPYLSSRSYYYYLEPKNDFLQSSWRSLRIGLRIIHFPSPMAISHTRLSRTLCLIPYLYRERTHTKVLDIHILTFKLEVHRYAYASVGVYVQPKSG